MAEIVYSYLAVVTVVIIIAIASYSFGYLYATINVSDKGLLVPPTVAISLRWVWHMYMLSEH